MQRAVRRMTARAEAGRLMEALRVFLENAWASGPTEIGAPAQDFDAVMAAFVAAGGKVYPDEVRVQSVIGTHRKSWQIVNEHGGLLRYVDGTKRKAIAEAKKLGRVVSP